jgi:hypothetical protein
MKINPLWYICLIVRLSLLFSIAYFYTKSENKKTVKIIGSLILLIMGLGFVWKAIFGSNNEIQISKVFWHETRYVHGLLYILASLYLYNDNIKMSSLLLFLDIVFSVSYRISTNK